MPGALNASLFEIAPNIRPTPALLLDPIWVPLGHVHQIPLQTQSRRSTLQYSRSKAFIEVGASSVSQTLQTPPVAAAC